MYFVQKMFIKLKTKEFYGCIFQKEQSMPITNKKIFNLVKLYILNQCHQGHITLILLYTSQVSFFSLRNLSSNISSTFLVHKWHVPIQWHELVKNQCQMITEIFNEKVSLEIHCNTKYK